MSDVIGYVSALHCIYSGLLSYKYTAKEEYVFYGGKDRVGQRNADRLPRNNAINRLVCSRRRGGMKKRGILSTMESNQCNRGEAFFNKLKAPEPFNSLELIRQAVSLSFPLHLLPDQSNVYTEC